MAALHTMYGCVKTCYSVIIYMRETMLSFAFVVMLSSAFVCGERIHVQSHTLHDVIINLYVPSKFINSHFIEKNKLLMVFYGLAQIYSKGKFGSTKIFIGSFHTCSICCPIKCN